MKPNSFVALVITALLGIAFSVSEVLSQSAASTPIAASSNGNVALTNELRLPYFYFVQDGDEVIVYGEVENIGTVPHRVPEIVFTFLDESGNEYVRGSASATSNWIGPGQRLGFQGFVIDTVLRIGDWASVAVSAGPLPSFEIDYYDLSQLQISGAEESGEVVEGETINGEIRNPTAEAIKLSSIDIEFRDRTGRFVGSCGDYVDASIPPGKFVRFSIDLTESGLCGFQYPAIDQSAGAPFEYTLILSRFSYS